jgi:UDP-GlcNAc:undecaprenyl-phosphate GlcNAc-1-phosphate transferase
LLGASVLVAVGLLDDRYELSAWPQLAAQTAAAVIAVGFGIKIDQVPNPFGTNLESSAWLLPPGVNELVTVVWLVGAVNAMNFVDGLDGLAAGIAVISAAVLFLHSSQLGQYSIALLPLALAGASLGFLPFNLTPARITLGTTGALFLGFALASQAVIGGTKAATALLVLGLPLLDAAYLIVTRTLRGQAPWQGDRTHLHHRLREFGLSERQVVLLFWGFSAAAGALALLLSSRLSKLYALGALALLVVVAFVLLARLSAAQAQGRPQGSVEPRV